MWTLHVPWHVGAFICVTWVIYFPLVSIRVHFCPLVSMCVLIPRTHFYNNLSSFEFRTGKMFFPTQVQIIPLLAFLCSRSILWKFRLSSDDYQQLHLPRKPRTDLTGFRRFVLAGHKGRWTREAAGEKKQDCWAQRSLLQRPGFVELMCLCEMMPEGWLSICRAAKCPMYFTIWLVTGQARNLLEGCQCGIFSISLILANYHKCTRY